MEIEFLGRKKKPVCDKVIVFSENGRKYEAKIQMRSLCLKFMLTAT